MEAIAFCNIAVMPVRETASHQAEMVTQLLFGEAYKIINYESNGWAKILTLFDNYEGYIDTKQIALMHTSAYQKYYLDTRPLIVNTLTEVHDKIRNCIIIVRFPTDNFICVLTFSPFNPTLLSYRTTIFTIGLTIRLMMPPPIRKDTPLPTNAQQENTCFCTELWKR